jgi:hypothetical protein
MSNSKTIAKYKKHRPCNSSQSEKNLGTIHQALDILFSLDAQCFGRIWILCAVPAAQRSPGAKRMQEKLGGTHTSPRQIIGWPYAFSDNELDPLICYSWWGKPAALLLQHCSLGTCFLIRWGKSTLT